MKYNILSSLLYIILQSSGICSYNDESRVLLQSFIVYCIVVCEIKDKLVAIKITGKDGSFVLFQTFVRESKFRIIFFYSRLMYRYI